jgi:xanthine dehydrogenase YagS FAD-binding subunit
LRAARLRTRASPSAASPQNPGARDAEKLLAGAAPDHKNFRRAAEAALTGAKPSGSNEFKIELARRIVVRALTLAAAGTPERIPALPASPFSTEPGAYHA